jgi:hypothetical protein
MFDKVVIWGHKLHSHTHSYIHYAFYKAFKYLGYDVYWLDNTDVYEMHEMNFMNSLFITEGGVDQKIPIVPDSHYIIHNCDVNKYAGTHHIILQVFTKDCYKRNDPEISKCFHFDGKTLYMPWATDLLPEEIERNIAKIENNELFSNINDNTLHSNKLYFVGTYVKEIDIAIDFCKKNNIEFVITGGYSGVNVTSEINEQMIKESALAPVIQRAWQIDNGYIPCRVFKNISYGRMPIVHSDVVNELFDNELIYSADLQTALQMGLEFEKKPAEYKKEKIIKLMKHVRDHHTYINRINLLLACLNMTI